MASFATVPNFATKVTKTATKNGNASDPAVWGAALADNDFFAVPAGLTVTWDLASSPNLAGGYVQGILDCGTAPGAKALTLATLLIDSGGKFTCGSCVSNTPLNGTFTLTFLDVAPDPTFDPGQFGTGLVTMGAQVDICGSASKTAWLWAQGASKGSTTLTLVSTPSEWNAGDQLLIPGTTLPYLASSGAWVRGDNQDEVVTIASVSGMTVTLTASLAYDHLPLPGPQGQTNYLPIGNLSRNIVFQSQNPAGTRGHVMFMRDMMGNPSIVNACHVLVKGCGRTDASRPVTDPMVDANGVLVPGSADNPRARYAWHSHRQGQKGLNGTTASCLQTWDSIVVWDYKKWAFDNHDSNVNATNLIAFSGQGAGFATERGSEIGTYTRCFSCRTSGSGTAEVIDSRRSRDDYGWLGSGVWLQGVGVTLLDCVLCNNAHSDIILDPGEAPIAGVITNTFDPTLLPDPSYAQGVGTINGQLVLRQLPFFGVHGNVGFGSLTGLFLWDSDPATQPTPLNFTGWGHVCGVHDFFANTQYLDVVLTGPNYGRGSQGYVMNPGYVNNVRFTPTTQIAGFETGVYLPQDANPYDYTVIEGGFYGNVWDFWFGASFYNVCSASTVFTAQPTFGSVSSTALAGRQRYNYYLEPNIDLNKAITRFGLQGQLNNSFYAPTPRPVCTLADGRQVFWPQQASDYIPFPSSASWTAALPSSLRDKTNAQLWQQYGLAVGYSLSTVDGSGKYADPSTNGLIGPSQGTLRTPWVLWPTPVTSSYPLLLVSTAHSDYPSGNPNTPRYQQSFSLQPGVNMLTVTVDGQPFTNFVTLAASPSPPPSPPPVTTSIAGTAAMLRSVTLTFSVTASNSTPVNEGSVAFSVSQGTATVARGTAPVANGTASAIVQLAVATSPYAFAFSYSDAGGTLPSSSGSGSFTVD